MHKKVWISLFILLVKESVCCAASVCPFPWTPIKDGCYKLVGHTNFVGYYHIMQALEDCMAEGGVLATIEDRETELQVYGLIKKYMQVGNESITRMYIGFTDIQKEGEYQWIDGAQSNYTNWATDEPNNVLQGNEDCVAIVSQDGLWQMNDKTVWRDYHCSLPLHIHYALCCTPQQTSKDVVNKSSTFTAQTKHVIQQLQKQCFGAEVNKCSRESCYHGGTCISDVTHFTCLCPKGHSGELCQFKSQCPGAPFVANTVRSEPRSNLRYYYGDTVQYACQEGFLFEGDADQLLRIITCTEDGYWYPDIPQCKEISCGDLYEHIVPMPVWGESDVNENIARKHFYYGVQLNYTCEEGFVLRNSTEFRYSQCTNTGEWDPPLQQCQEIVCAPIPTWRGLKFHVINNDESGPPRTDTTQLQKMTFNIEINYTCSEEGYILSNQNASFTSTCSISGQWSPDIMECVETENKSIAKKRVEDPPSEAPGASAVGSVALIVMLTELGLLILIDAGTLLKHMHMFCVNITSRCRHAEKNIANAVVCTCTHCGNNGTVCSKCAASAGSYVYSKVPSQHYKLNNHI